jgi:hypothetical protein
MLRSRPTSYNPEIVSPLVHPGGSPGTGVGELGSTGLSSAAQAPKRKIPAAPAIRALQTFAGTRLHGIVMSELRGGEAELSYT